ncbi:MAG: hypothetical protein KDC24_15500, partial [Saprospiraceae bacterium]|nr:hypothetical protein [Saprospiraceae bacterium]
DLIIELGGSLRLGCRVSVPPGGKIVVRPGATLILENTQLHNDCGETWKGIEIQKSKNAEGEVIFIGNVKIQDAEFPIERDASGKVVRRERI